MNGMTYFRIGVPNDMVADIMWHDDFEVSMEPITLKPETNYQRCFGTPEKAAESLMRDKWAEPFNRWYYKNDKEGYRFAYLTEWMDSEAE